MNIFVRKLSIKGSKVDSSIRDKRYEWLLQIEIINMGKKEVD